ncbi:unnamed protein product [Chrysoparadoxa australica]
MHSHGFSAASFEEWYVLENVAKYRRREEPKVKIKVVLEAVQLSPLRTRMRESIAQGKPLDEFEGEGEVEGEVSG